MVKVITFEASYYMRPKVITFEASYYMRAKDINYEESYYMRPKAIASEASYYILGQSLLNMRPVIRFATSYYICDIYTPHPLSPLFN